jgi:hypothetical protein
MVGLLSTLFPRRQTRRYFAKNKKKKLQLFYNRPTAIISLKQNFSLKLKCVLKGREFYTTQEEGKVAEQLSNFFQILYGKWEKLKHCSNVYVNA